MNEAISYQIAAACQLLGLSRATLYKEIAAGRIAVLKVGRRTLVSRRALEAYVEAREREAEAVKAATAQAAAR